MPLPLGWGPNRSSASCETMGEIAATVARADAAVENTKGKNAVEPWAPSSAWVAHEASAPASRPACCPLGGEHGPPSAVPWPAAEGSDSRAGVATGSLDVLSRELAVVRAAAPVTRCPTRFPSPRLGRRRSCSSWLRASSASSLASSLASWSATAATAANEARCSAAPVPSRLRPKR